MKPDIAFGATRSVTVAIDDDSSLSGYRGVPRLGRGAPSDWGVGGHFGAHI